jgi:hypothetical protein
VVGAGRSFFKSLQDDRRRAAVSTPTHVSRSNDVVFIGLRPS